MEAFSDAQAALFASGGALTDYAILKPIGKGKFSVVYRAKRMADDVLVALKKIAIDVMDKRAREKTLKEVRLVQSVHHPNIIQYLDAFIAGNELCIAFEWAEAGDLKRQIRKANEKGTRFDERLVWKYFAQIAAAIDHMHTHRIMHRDIKPANIFLTSSGQVKVGDLGLGRHLSENTMEAHSKVGTPLYMSPEVLRGDGYDWKCDVWSLGCILYELAMLRSPFKSEGLNLYGLFQKVNKGEYDAVSDIYSDALRSLVTQMLSLNANDRPTMAAICAVSSACHESRAVPKIHPRPASVDNQKEPTTTTSSRQSTPNNNMSATPESSPRVDDTATTMYLMDAVYEKLTLLQCNLHTLQVPLTRIYFAQASRHPQQWTHALRLLQWLFSKLEVTLDVALDDPLEPPLRQATAVLIAVGRLGCDAAATLSPSSMLAGHGLALCTALDALCSKALRPLVTTRHPIKDNDDDDCADDGHLEWQVDDESTALASSADDNDYDDYAVYRVGAAPDAPEATPAIDPVAWSLEIQKNAPRIRSSLAAAYNQAPSWHDHVTALQSFVHKTPVEDVQSLRALPTRLHDDLDRVQLKEKTLNNVLLSDRSAYQRLFDAQIHLSSRLQTKEHKRRSLDTELTTLQTSLATTKSTLHTVNDKLTDVSQLTGLRAALTTLRADIQSMELTLELQQRTLLQAQTNAQTRQRRLHNVSY